MTNHTASSELRTPSGTTRPPVGRRVSLDWVMVVLGGWWLGGLYLDGWAHNHLSTTLESFLTPWHAAFYSASWRWRVRWLWRCSPTMPEVRPGGVPCRPAMACHG